MSHYAENMTITELIAAAQGNLDDALHVKPIDELNTHLRAQVFATLALAEAQRAAAIAATLAYEGGPYKHINKHPGAAEAAFYRLVDMLGITTAPGSD